MVGFRSITGRKAESQRANSTEGRMRRTARLDVDLVTVFFTASGRSGRRVEDLRKEELILFDGDQRREIRYLWREADLPLTVGLIADVSISQSAFLGEHRRTISSFFQRVLRPRDLAFIVSVAAEVDLVTDVTGSVPELEAGVGRLDPLQRYGKRPGPECPPKALPPAPDGTPRFVTGCGGSDIWDAVYYAARLKMKPLSGCRALILLSDGFDTGSLHSVSDAIEAAQGADTLIYTIIYPIDFGRFVLVEARLSRLADETGGRSFFASKQNLPAIFSQIEDDLRNLSVLAFTPPPEACDGRARHLTLTAARRGVRIRARTAHAIPPKPGR
jgi:VWFA-related protein